MTRWGWSESRAAKGVDRLAWMRPFSSAVPWITVMLLLLMFHLVGGTFTSAEGVLFDLPAVGETEGAKTQLVALVLPMSRENSLRETLVFFDDARYVLGDAASENSLGAELAARAAKTGDRTLLLLADRRVSGGDLMRLAALVRSSGVERVLFAERKESGADE